MAVILDLYSRQAIGWLMFEQMTDALQMAIFKRKRPKGNCYDNACAESFFHSLKVEAIHGERFVTREALRQTVFEYIETDYNRLRLHSANGYQSPVAFEADFYQPLASGSVHF